MTGDGERVAFARQGRHAVMHGATAQIGGIGFRSQVGRAALALQYHAVEPDAGDLEPPDGLAW